MTTVLAIEPLTKPPRATVRPPGSKSITNRALVCAALASGTSTLRRALVADDTAAMVECLGSLGVSIGAEGDDLVVTGTGGAPARGPVELQARQAGTVARFLPPLVVLGEGEYRIDGAPQMRARPMSPVVDALRQLGVDVVATGDDDRLPLVVRGGVEGGTVQMRGDISSQFLSGLMLSAPRYRGGLRVTLTSPLVSRPYVEMTAAVMVAFGADAHVGESEVTVPPGTYRPCDYSIEPDASAASYFLAAAAITDGRVRIDGLGEPSLQGDVAFLDVLEGMGAEVARTAHSLTVNGTGSLEGIEADLSHLSDTVPTAAVVAAFASSPTRVRGVGFIRQKESDRIAAVVRELRRCGAAAEEEPDGLVVTPAPLHGARIETYEDHRMAMAFALIGLRVPGIEIVDPGCVGKTFPHYFSMLDGLRV